MQVAFIHVNKPKSSPGSRPLFCSSRQHVLGGGHGFGILPMASGRDGGGDSGSPAAASVRQTVAAADRPAALRRADRSDRPPSRSSPDSRSPAEKPPRPSPAPPRPRSQHRRSARTRAIGQPDPPFGQEAAPPDPNPLRCSTPCRWAASSTVRPCASTSSASARCRTRGSGSVRVKRRSSSACPVRSSMAGSSLANPQHSPPQDFCQSASGTGFKSR